METNDINENDSVYKKMAKFIKAVAGERNVITIPRMFFNITGELETALFLNQCIYWCDKSNRTDGSFYKTYTDWQEELDLTERKIDHARAVLSTLGFVSTKVHRANGHGTLHYYVNLQRVTDAIQSFTGDPDRYKGWLATNKKIRIDNVRNPAHADQ